MRLSNSGWLQLLTSLDRWLLAAGAVTLGVLIFTSARANISHDSVDYYAILQWLTPAEEVPIVHNLHFAEQRSPGYSLTAFLMYGLLTAVIEPFISTQKVVDTGVEVRQPPPPHSGPHRPPQPGGPEHMMIPARPLLLKEVPFKDFYLPREGSWFQWKLALALALTSYLFLFLGMAANGWTLRLRYRPLSGYFLVPLTIFASPIFMRNILDTPLYATLTAYGGSSLFALFFLKGYASWRTRDLLPAGFFLGLVVLTRLEVGVLAGALALLLIARKEWGLAMRLALGAMWVLPVWIAYNLTVFGTPVHLGILRGDINLLMFNLSYIVDNLFHPSSGILFWSPLLALGLVGLLFSRSAPLRMLGICSLVLLAVYLVRVPVMYLHAGGGPIEIGGILVTPPSSPAGVHELVRSDINRYVTVLAPLAVLGLRDGLGRLWERWRRTRPRRAHA